jgi:hypothetical protein
VDCGSGDRLETTATTEKADIAQSLALNNFAECSPQAASGYSEISAVVQPTMSQLGLTEAFRSCVGLARSFCREPMSSATRVRARGHRAAVTPHSTLHDSTEQTNSGTSIDARCRGRDFSVRRRTDMHPDAPYLGLAIKRLVGGFEV